MGILNIEEHRLQLCISFWETRKFRGFLAFFYPFHNLSCEFKAQGYRSQLRKLQAKRG